MRITVLFFIALTLLIPASASSTPLAWFQFEGGDPIYFDDWVLIDPVLDVWHLDFAVMTSDYAVSGSVTAKRDPFISYGITAQNLTGATRDYVFHVDSPINQVTSPNQALATYAASMTDVTGNGVSLAPLWADMDGDGIPEVQMANANGTNLGVDVGRFFSHPGTGYPNSYTSGPYNAGPQPGPIGVWDRLGTDVAFQLSGDRDVATLNGLVDFRTSPVVPEPSSVLLVGGGLLFSGLYLRRRRS